MVILIAVFGAIILTVGIIIYIKSNSYNLAPLFYAFNIVGSFLLVIAIIAALSLGIPLSNRAIIDDMITLYLDENEKIERQIEVAIESYKGYESETLEKFKTEDPTTTINLYPELKSDTLISKQLDLYMQNSTTIKTLKCRKLSYKSFAWWLYFGE